MNKRTRLGIFLFFDDDGIVYDYVRYLLDDIKSNFDRLVIVCNGMISQEGIQILQKYSSQILVRPNIGFDAGGFKDAIVNYLGFDTVCEYEEVVLFNDSFFGPFYEFRKVFDEMDRRAELDYWGLTAHGETPKIYGLCPYGYRPRYIQTYFVAFRKKLTCSEIFRKYWIDMPVFKTFEEAAENFGCYFTKLFEDNGFKWSVYSDTADLESEQTEKNMSFHTFNIYEMIANRRLPIIKRKTFVTDKKDTLRYNWGGDLAKAIKYIDEKTEYDTSLIYKYLLKKYNLDDLKKSLNLVKVIPDVDMFCGKKLYSNKRVAVIVHTFYEDLLDYTLFYLKNIPEEVDVIVTNSSKEKIKLIEKKFRPILKNRLTIIKVNARGRDLSALLVGCRKYIEKYDYLCFLHDKKSSQKEYVTVGSFFSDLLWDNILHSEAYITNILNHFESNPCLGLMVPPNVYHGTYYSSATDYWTICFERCKSLMTALNIDVPLDRKKEPFSVGSVFWCKTDALKNLFNYEFNYSDFPAEPLPGDGSISHALERIFPYIAQYNGYYTECVMNPEYASAEITNYRLMHTETLKAIHKFPYVQFRTYSNMISSIEKSSREYNVLLQRSRNSTALQNPPTAAGNTVSQGTTTVIYQELGLKAAFVKFAKKRFPKPLYKIISKLLKYDC